MEGEGGAEDGGEGERTAQPASVVQVKSTQQGALALSPLRLPHCPTPSQAVGLCVCVCRLGNNHSGHSVGSDVLSQVVTSVSVYLPAALGLP